jgi:3-phosphoshikimate 1-carboxyvinyltransferase
MLAAMADGRSEIVNLPGGADVQSTAACIRQLGVTVEVENGTVLVGSCGRLTAPACDLHAGNSGTTMRLLCGILAGQPFRSRLTGDASLSSRPMERVAEPLRLMGASIETNGGTAPIKVRGSQLTGVSYRSPVASAQVKSAILFAGVFAEGETAVHEPARSRDHTERMLAALGVPVRVSGTTASVLGGQRPQAFRATLPGDPSSAAFFFAATALTGGQIEIEGLLLNETRSRFLDVLERMGARVERQVEREEIGEPVGSVSVRGDVTQAVHVGADEVPGLIDELPLVALLATQSDGVSEIRGAAELRLKETDRIDAVVTSLRAMGADIEALPDGFVVRGPTPLAGTEMDSRGDHRVAMMLAVAGVAAEGTTTIEGAEAADVSLPSFATLLQEVGGAIHAV